MTLEWLTGATALTLFVLAVRALAGARISARAMRCG